MGFLAHCREALLNLFSAKLRSLLAILGILVGTGSVVALISSSQLATEHALSQFKKLGTNLLAVSLNSKSNLPRAGQTRELSVNDLTLIQQQIPGIDAIAPYTNLYKSVNFQDIELNGQVLGATEEIADLVKIKLQEGRFVSTLDDGDFYCVVGTDVAKKIRAKGLEPLNQLISVGRNLYTIVGVADHWEPNLFLFSNINEGIIIPLSLSLLMGQEVQIQNLILKLKPDASITSVKDQLTEVLAHIVPDKQVNFRDPQQIIDVVNKQRSTFTWLLSAIGSISLLVGGIGVMNIMLVSVIERRREIGVRMAIGARRKDILEMFLIESVILTGFGGLVGVFMGTLVTFTLAFLSGWEYNFHLFPVMLGFLVSTAVGMFSGFYPSYRASRLDPIATLQSE